MSAHARPPLGELRTFAREAAARRADAAERRIEELGALLARGR